MKPLCEVVVTNVLPAVRAIIAKHLKDKYNMKGIAEGKLNEKEEVLAFCDICKLIRREKVICELHAKTPIVSCDICSS